MSLFETQTVECPACGGQVPFSLVFSVNADRKPALRDQILDESFQREDCPGCKHGFRIEPELTYLDVGRGVWIGCWQASRLSSWQTWAQQAQASFDKAFGKGGPAEARAIGDGLTVRVTFGWSALREKIVALEAGIDDVALELAKATIIRQEGGAPPANADLRLLAADDEALVLAWVDREGGLRTGEFAVDRSLLDGIEQAGAAYDALRADVDGGIHVDLQRALLVPAAR